LTRAFRRVTPIGLLGNDYLSRIRGWATKNNQLANALDRRAFLKAGTAAVAGFSALPTLLQADDKKDEAFGGFVVGCQSYTFRDFSVEQALKQMRELGLHYVEFFGPKHVAVNSTPEQIKATLKMCGDYGIKPVAFGVQSFTKNHDANKKTFEFGKALGVQALSADPSRDSFDSLDKLVEEYKIAIAIHPHGPQGKTLHQWYSAEIIMDAVKDQHPLIGTCLDTGHLIRSAQLGKNLDSAQQVRVMGARNFGMHLKDHDNQTKTDVVFGKGVLDVPGVLKALKDVKFKGYISIEYEAHPENPSPDVKACIDVFKDAVKGLT
jgi:inosose dehydratase